MQKIKKSRVERRKELSHWVNLLLNNLRKINETLEHDGEEIQQLFKKEDEARKAFESQKKRGSEKEEKMRQEIANMKKKLSALIESN